MRRAALSVLALAAGCAGPADEEPQTCAPTVQRIEVTDAPDDVDLLFVIDDSASMSAEQRALGDALSTMVEVLTSGDRDADGVADFAPVSSLRVGVVTTDMGAAGHDVPTCGGSRFGGDGVLRRRGDETLDGCAAEHPPFLDWRPGSITPEAYAADVACVVRAGTDGCGVEQPLEAALKALSPPAPTPWTADGWTPPTFLDGTLGHALDANEGFVRERSILAVAPVTDEDDCSLADPALFDPTGPYASTEQNLRCIEHEAEALHAVDRYVDGLLGLRRHPGLLVFAPIAGIPPELDSRGGFTRWDELLDHPDMQPREDPTAPGRPAPACERFPERSAAPASRIARVARALEGRGARASITSICNPDYRHALDQLVQLVRPPPWEPDCVPRVLPVDPDGSVPCVVDVIVDDVARCAELPDATPGGDGDGPRCRLPQLVPADRSPGRAPPSGPGWYYDDFSGEGSCATADGEGPWQIVLNTEPPPGTVVRVSCQPSAAPPRCSVDADCAGLDGATCVDSECRGWRCEEGSL